MTDRRLKQLIFVVAAVTYAAVGYWLQIGHGFILGDSLARVAAAQSTVFSREPHLAAIGFIFTPLTSMLEIPGVLASPWFPDLTARAYTASLMTAVFMAGAVVQIASMGTDRGLRRGFVLAITVLFALNPMIVFYGSNGMSEAPFLFFLTWAVRRLLAWTVDDDVHHLVTAGFIAMGLAYLTRYDAAAAVGAAGIVVGAITYRRATAWPRIRRALLDILMVSLPGAASFVGWAVASWLITGQAFAQFSSQYGNAAILKQSGGSQVTDFGSGLTFAATCATLLAPTLVPLAIWVCYQRAGRPNWQTIVIPIAMYGSVLAFQAYTYASGSTFGFLRFYIAAIPLAACLAMLALPDGVLRPAVRRGKYAPSPPLVPTTRRRTSGVLVAATFAISIPATAWGMTLPAYAPQEYALAAVLAPEPNNTSDRRAVERRIAASFSTEREIASYIDGLDLRDGSVIVDTVYGFAVVAASERPRTFVVPSDPDFVRRLNDPAAFGVRYLLAVPNKGRGLSDAVNVRYPTLYDSGADISTLELEFLNSGDSQPDWRLYRVLERYDPTG